MEKKKAQEIVQKWAVWPIYVSVGFWAARWTYGLNLYGLLIYSKMGRLAQLCSSGLLGLPGGHTGLIVMGFLFIQKWAVWLIYVTVDYLGCPVDIRA